MSFASLKLDWVHAAVEHLGEAMQDPLRAEVMGSSLLMDLYGAASALHDVRGSSASPRFLAFYVRCRGTDEVVDLREGYSVLLAEVRGGGGASA